MARVALFALVAVVGCASFSAATPPDVDAGAAPEASTPSAEAASDAPATSSGPPAVVQTASVESVSNVQTLGLTLAPTVAGNLLVVAIAIDDFTQGVVGSVTDSASDSFTIAGLIARDSEATNSNEIWYAKANAGVTHIDVTVTGPIPLELWALEVSGVSTVDVAASQDGTNQQSSVAAAPQVTPTIPNAFVVSLMSNHNGAYEIVSGNPFKALQIHRGNDAAYLIASSVGSYGAAWNIGQETTFDAVTVAFR